MGASAQRERLSFFSLDGPTPTPPRKGRGYRGYNKDRPSSIPPPMPDPRILAVTLDEASLGGRGDALELEKRVALNDLAERSSFAPAIPHEGPFRVHLRCEEGRLAIDVADGNGAPLRSYGLGMTGFKRPIRDYHAICDSYGNAVRRSSAHEIETVDMARRGLHDAAAELLRERLAGKIAIDFDTARRLFTLIAVLHARG